MKISNIHNQAFCKKMVSACLVTSNLSKKKNPAILWEYDASNPVDRKEVTRDKMLPNYIKDEFAKAYSLGGQSKKLYVLKDEKIQHLVSYAQTTHRIRPKSAQFNGRITQIDEAGVSYRYANPMEPVIAQILKDANDRNDIYVFSSMHKDDFPCTDHIKFSQTKLGELYIPKRRYNSVIDKAQERSSIVFVD